MTPTHEVLVFSGCLLGSVLLFGPSSSPAAPLPDERAPRAGALRMEPASSFRPARLATAPTPRAEAAPRVEDEPASTTRSTAALEDLR
ncbi:MAG: hypothetical protein ACAI25_05340, partial [Planctomycetota bacterium]